MKTIIFAWLTFNISLVFAQPSKPYQALIDQLHVPDGFKVSIYADNVPGARSLALGDRGVVFVGTRQPDGSVYAVQDSDGDGVVDQRYLVASHLVMPNGVAYRNGALYVAEINRISRYDNILNHLTQPAKAVVVYDQLPQDTHHGWKYLRFGPDDKLYTAVGMPCNVCKPEKAIYGSLVRLNSDGSQFEIIASGIRNSVGFDWQPESNALFFTDNGRDYLGDDLPPEELNRWATVGEHFGFPYFHAGNLADPEFFSTKKNQDFTAPVWQFKAHVAPLGMRFYRGNRFPKVYRNQLLVAQHGSWNRTQPDGYRVVWVKFAKQKPVAEEIFMDGWLDKQGKVSGRPVDILELPDGSVLISDDQLGIIYRINYQGSS